MVFTREDILKILNALLQLGRKDSEFKDASTPLNSDDYIAILQDGINKKVSINNLLSTLGLLKKDDFINVSDRYDEYYIHLSEAITIIANNKRKKGLVITFLDLQGNWKIFQFNGEVDNFSNTDYWKDLFDFKYPIVNSVLPDEEDLTLTLPNEDNNSFIKLKDKEYDTTNFSGMGTKIIRKNIIEITLDDGTIKRINYLSPDVFDSENTIYIIRYDFILNTDITIPANCVLKFDGGSLSNGNITLENNCTFVGGCHKELCIIVSENSKILNCSIKNETEVKCCVTGYIKNLHIEGCSFENIADGPMQGDYVTSDINCIYLRPKYNCSYVEIKNNTFIHRRMGIEVWGNLVDNEPKIDNFIIEGNSFKAWDIALIEQNKYACWPISFGISYNNVAAQNTIENLIIANNILDGGRYGIELPGGPKYVDCSFNVIKNCYIAYVNSKSQKSVITNNTFIRKEGHTTAIYLHSDNCNFVNNTILGGCVMFENRTNIIISSNYIRQDADISYTDGTIYSIYSRNANNINIINNVIENKAESDSIGDISGDNILVSENIIEKPIIINNEGLYENNYYKGFYNPPAKYYDKALNVLNSADVPFGYSIFERTNNRELIKGTNRIFTGIGNYVNSNLNGFVPTTDDNRKGFWNWYGYSPHQHNGILICFGSGYSNTNIVQVLFTQNRVNISGDVPVIADNSDGVFKVLYRHFTYENNVWTAGNWNYVFKEGVSISPEVPTNGIFADKPANVPIGFAYFCTDKQTAEGATNGIMIYHKGSNVWVDAFGRVVS